MYARLAVPLLFIGPALFSLGLLVYWPLIYTCYLSLLNWNLVSRIGISWAQRTISSWRTNRTFWIAVKNTLLYLLVLLPVELIFPLALALLLQSIAARRLRELYQGLIFSPTVLSFAIASIVWVWMFNPMGGVLAAFSWRWGCSRSPG